MAEPIGPCTPLLIVGAVPRSLDHYVERLGFACMARTPNHDPFFAIVARGSAQIMLKAISPDVSPLPNHQRHAWARWDVFIFVSDPDALAREFADRAVPFHQPIADTDDGLRGFEIADPDGYVCFFGRPLS
ncbi:MAG: VOC family protein [Pseudomonadota bacterium]